MSATLFHLALLQRIKKSETLRNRAKQIIAYADDVATITKQKRRETKIK